MAEKLHQQLRQWSWWSRLLAAAIGIGVALVLAGFFRNNASEAQTNMRSILDAISNESTAVTNEYLAGPETAATVVAGMMTAVNDDPALQQALFANLITATPQIDAVFIGFPDGTFSFVARADDTFRIRNIDGPELTMTETIATSDLTTITSQTLTDSTYDPRKRSWYEPIAAGEATSWSDPYLFSSSKKLGVTYSVGLRDERNELSAVVGVDLTLDDLVAFLKERQPSAKGSAQVVNASGLVLAGSETDVAGLESDEGLELTRLPLAAAVIEQAQQSASVDGSQINGQFIDGERWGNVSAVSASNSWYLLVESPESDFNAQSQGLLSGTTAQIALWSLLAFVVVYTGLVAGGRRVLQLNNMATVDELTGLLNRSGIFRELGATLSAANGSRDLVVAILDLDRFKAVNDSYGHAIGDETLTQAARRISAAAERYNMQCGRLGGDEFVVFGKLADHASVLPMWREIRHDIAALSMVSGTSIDLSTSIGVAAWPHAVPDHITAVLHSADRALYIAKRNGGDQTSFTTHSLDSPINVDAQEIVRIDATGELAER